MNRVTEGQRGHTTEAQRCAEGRAGAADAAVDHAVVDVQAAATLRDRGGKDDVADHPIGSGRFRSARVLRSIACVRQDRCDRMELLGL